MAARTASATPAPMSTAAARPSAIVNHIAKPGRATEPKGAGPIRYCRRSYHHTPIAPQLRAHTAALSKVAGTRRAGGARLPAYRLRGWSPAHGHGLLAPGHGFLEHGHGFLEHGHGLLEHGHGLRTDDRLVCTRSQRCNGVRL